MLRVAAGAGDHAALLDALRARPVAFREAAREEQGIEASCLIATGGDLVWDTQGGNDGFVSLSEFEQLRGEDAVDAFLESELTAAVRQGVPLLAFDGEHRQLERRGVAHTAAVYRALGGDAEEVGFLGDDALLLRCAVDELVRRGARARKDTGFIGDGPRAARPPSYGMATAFLGGGEDDYAGLDEGVTVGPGHGHDPLLDFSRFAPSGGRRRASFFGRRATCGRRLLRRRLLGRGAFCGASPSAPSSR